MLQTVPAEAFALLAVAAWTLSAPVINDGLKRLHASVEVENGEGDPYRIAVGLAAALVVGTVLLTPVALVQARPLPFTPFVILSGLFTFPIGTGLYYYTAEKYRDKAEIAAQFVKVKPIFSVLFGLALGEVMGASKAASLLLIVAGTALLIYGTVRAEFSMFAFGVGLATAFTWSVGEAFVKLGLGGESSLGVTYVALLTGTIAYLAVAGPLIARADVSVSREVRRPWIRRFAMHGVLSFATAYASFFTAIQHLGLGRTALVTAFWPVLAILLENGLKAYRGEDTELRESAYFIPAAVVLVTGSLLALIAPL